MNGKNNEKAIYSSADRRVRGNKVPLLFERAETIPAEWVTKQAWDVQTKSKHENE